MRLRPVDSSDREEWLRMRRALYGDDPSLAEEVDRHFAGRDAMTVLVIERPEGGLCAFAELGTRSIAEGCLTSPVAYLEGLYVDPGQRRMGLGQRLVVAAEAWARSRGLSELASDALVTNDASIAFHKAAGFDDVERIVCFRKDLRPNSGP